MAWKLSQRKTIFIYIIYHQYIDERVLYMLIRTNYWMGFTVYYILFEEEKLRIKFKGFNNRIRYYLNRTCDKLRDSNSSFS